MIRALGQPFKERYGDRDLKIAFNCTLDYSELMKFRGENGKVADLLLLNCVVVNCPRNMINMTNFLMIDFEYIYFEGCHFTSQEFADDAPATHKTLATTKDIDNLINHLLDQRNKLTAKA